jgi:hypothetical protein
MSKCISKFKDSIFNNKIYYGLKANYEDIKETFDHNGEEINQTWYIFWIKYQKKIYGFFEDIQLLHNFVMDSSKEISNIFDPSLKIIAKTFNVKILCNFLANF